MYLVNIIFFIVFYNGILRGLNNECYTVIELLVYYGDNIECIISMNKLLKNINYCDDFLIGFGLINKFNFNL